MTMAANLEETTLYEEYGEGSLVYVRKLLHARGHQVGLPHRASPRMSSPQGTALPGRAAPPMRAANVARFGERSA